MTELKYSCYSCKKEVPQEHFISDEGKILCQKCSEGVKECSDRVREILKKYQE